MAVTRKKTLTATVGAGAAALLLSYVPMFEGTILRGHHDPIGIVTACTGHTKTAVLGRPYSAAECKSLLDADLVEHAQGVLRCTPSLAGKTHQLAAASSFAFNVGVGAYCGSSIARAFNAGDAITACKRFNENASGRPQWVSAGGRVLPGLVKRRAIERQMCEGRL